MEKVTVIGAGLAGSEAAWQIACRGVKVILYEMRPQKMTPAHQSGYFAELVCSNSLRAISLQNAVGLLKEEMRQLNSLIIKCALEARIPAGGALAVDRDDFARRVTRYLQENSLIEIRCEEVDALPKTRPVIIATGPLTSQALVRCLESFTGLGNLYFYDAAAPIVTYESINPDKVFFASRYGKGGDDYLNCPMSKEEYELFRRELCEGEVAPRKEFEEEILFEGCMPIEVLAKRGEDTLRYGPLKPVGITDPRSGKQPYAVVQLRKDNREGTLYNMVGFQTRLKWPEQKRIFRLIPGLEKAQFVRFGVMHRNTFINSPLLLKPTLQMREHPDIFWAGQITGVEGYVESAATGLVAGINAYRFLKGEDPLIFPAVTALGALTNYITTADFRTFQPMNINFGLFSHLSPVFPKKVRKELFAKRSLENLLSFQKKYHLLLA
ncbi:MAG: methylenetetrahydrofolate--tRNA-(uracil(54)-C(5))-methyltransferase (FADH(2)-oxidizing) TrmFO [Firmicutes bacterium]|nr:methylenetetrahydrofolate--tRNA-(uracil(54)-C(5))-methyltransferase (FADH(2)-oxidizing) TrmFO [Bacillota bacterium]